MSLESSLSTKLVALVSIFTVAFAPIANADPVVGGEILPPASAAYIDDPDLIKKIGVGREEDPVWCYSNDANAILISAAQREKEKCELKLSQQKQKLEATHKLQLDTLRVQIESITNKHEQTLIIKNKEIQDLTESALKRPNDYSFWWASGGFAAGVLTVLSIMWATK